MKVAVAHPTFLDTAFAAGAAAHTPEHNLAAYSYDASQWLNTWSGGVTRTYQTGETTAPDGSGNATKLARADSNNDSIYTGFSAAITLLPNASYVQSIYTAGGTAARSSVDIYDSVNASYLSRSSFNWSAGVPSLNATDADEAGFIDLKNGWYRLYQVFTTASNGASHNPLFIPESNGSANEYVYAWGAQLSQAFKLTKHIITNG